MRFDRILSAVPLSASLVAHNRARVRSRRSTFNGKVAQLAQEALLGRHRTACFCVTAIVKRHRPTAGTERSAVRILLVNG